MIYPESDIENFLLSNVGLFEVENSYNLGNCDDLKFNPPDTQFDEKHKSSSS